MYMQTFIEKVFTSNATHLFFARIIDFLRSSVVGIFHVNLRHHSSAYFLQDCLIMGNCLLGIPQSVDKNILHLKKKTETRLL